MNELIKVDEQEELLKSVDIFEKLYGIKYSPIVRCPELSIKNPLTILSNVVSFLNDSLLHDSVCKIKLAETLAELATKLIYCKEFDEKDREVFWPLRTAVLTEIFWTEETLRKSFGDEFTLQKKFKENVSYLIPGAIVINKKTDRVNIPDAFVQIEQQIRPVEVKLKEFNNAAVRQLNRYIKAYSADAGYAVAPKLKAPFPKNIIFIKLGL